MTFVSALAPEAVWCHFDRILAIPRGSGNESGMRAHVISVAQQAGLSHCSDVAGSLVVKKPASDGAEGAAVTILQSHLDMVNEKDSDVVHDFDRDPIRPRLVGDCLRATGTTLGADNGVGVAAMLAIAADRSLRHPPLELLFTVDEESGLRGAARLDATMLTGADVESRL
jgi:dipeptidase D